MMAFLGIVSVACITLVSYIVTTATTIGFMEILGIAVFGCVGAIAMLLFATFCMAKYTGHKVKSGVKYIRSKAKKLKA